MSDVEDQDEQQHKQRAVCGPSETGVAGVHAGSSQGLIPREIGRDPRHLSTSGWARGPAGVGSLQNFSSHYYGPTYNTANTIYGPANVFNHVENMVFEGNSDLATLDALFPEHPPVSISTNAYLLNSRLEDEKVIWNWTRSSVGALVLWIHGPAGIGKSTLARHVQQQMRSEGRLAAAIFLSAFPRTNPPSSERIIRLIAGELGRIHNDAISAIMKAHRQCHGLPPEALVAKLIVDGVRSLRVPQPLIVVLDAADEWPSHGAFMGALPSLDPSVIRFVVFGRLELQGRVVQNLSIKLYPLGRVSDDVMECYLNWRVDQVEWEPEPKPSSYDLRKLAEKADGLFIWAVTACSLLEDKFSPCSPRETLAAILDSRRSLGESSDLAALYRSAIILLFPRPEDRVIANTFLGAVIVLQEPLPLAAFSSLVGMRELVIITVQARLKALQIKQPPDHHLHIHPAGSSFHLSLIEFLRGAFPGANPTVLSFTSHAGFAKVGVEELIHLPSLTPESTAQSLSPFHVYIVKYLALHLSNGAPDVKPGVASDWEASQICSTLRHAPRVAVQQWCFLLLRLVEL